MTGQDIPASGSISADLAQRLLNLEDSGSLRRLVRQGWIKKGTDGKYNLVLTVHGYIAHLKDSLKRASKSSAAQAKDQARTREIELRIAERERRLVPIEEAQALVDSVIGVLRAELNGLPARVSRDREVRHKIDREVQSILTRASKRLRENLAALRAGGTVADAEPEDDA